MQCKYFNSLKLIKVLKKHNVTINMKDNQGRTALMHEIYNANIDVVKFLITQKAQIHEIDLKGNSILMYCVIKIIDYKKTMDIFSKGQVRDVMGKKFKKLKVQQVAIAAYLLKHGADLTKKNNAGNTFLSLSKK